MSSPIWYMQSNSTRFFFTYTTDLLKYFHLLWLWCTIYQSWYCSYALWYGRYWHTDPRVTFGPGQKLVSVSLWLIKYFHMSSCHVLHCRLIDVIQPEQKRSSIHTMSSEGLKTRSPFPNTSSLRLFSLSSRLEMKPLTPAYRLLKKQHIVHIRAPCWDKHNSRERESCWAGAAILSWVHTFWRQWANPARLFSLLFRRTRTPRIWACPHLRGGGLSR